MYQDHVDPGTSNGEGSADVEALPLSDSMLGTVIDPPIETLDLSRESLPSSEDTTLRGELAHSPALGFSIGNVCLAASTAESVGLALTGATAIATASMVALEHFTGRRIGLPYYVLSAVNATTAGSILYNGANAEGIEALLNFHSDAMKYLLAAGAFSGWAIGHAIKGYSEIRRTSNSVFGEQTWYGVGDIAAVQGAPYSSAFFVLGLTKALSGSGDSDDNLEISPSLSQFLQKHITPARLYGIGYIVGSLLSFTDPKYAAAQMAWGFGYLNFEQNKNGRFLQDLKSVMRNSIYWIKSLWR